MPMIAVVLNGKQAVVGRLCIRQHIPGRGAVTQTDCSQQESDKPALRHNQFFGGGAEVVLCLRSINRS